MRHVGDSAEWIVSINFAKCMERGSDKLSVSLLINQLRWEITCLFIFINCKNQSYSDETTSLYLGKPKLNWSNYCLMTNNYNLLFLIHPVNDLGYSIKYHLIIKYPNIKKAMKTSRTKYLIKIN